MKKIVVVLTLLSIIVSSCTSLRIKKSIENLRISPQTESAQNQFEGNYNLTISFGEPFGEIDVSLKIFYEGSVLSSTISYFNGEESIPVKVNATELFEGAIFINLVDSEAGNVEMEIYFDDENSISGFYAGQFEFKGEKIN
jgi:hypothetical protein